MRGRRIGGAICLVWVVVVSCGCGQGQPQGQAADTAAVASRPSLTDLTGSSREELFRRGDEVAAQIQTRSEARRKGNLTFPLLPRTWQPLVLPGIRDLRYHADLGMSLPGYLDPSNGRPDPELALLYAAYGDLEAARKLAGSQAGDLSSYALGRNYPVEWTRLAALQLHDAGQRIALGEREALADLARLRSEIQAALDEAARTSPLGRYLLALERRVVELAAQAWRQSGDTALAEQAAALLADWPAVAPLPAPLDQPADFWSRALRQPREGQWIRGVPVLRALDFLQLPLPAQHLDGVLLFFDERERLAEVVLTYTARIQDICPRASELAGVLSCFTAADPEATPTRALQQVPGWTIETRLGPVDATVGAWVRWTRQGHGSDPPPVAVPRELGPLHLDRRFETNRLAVAPQQLDNPLVLREGQGLEHFANPLPQGRLSEVILVRHAEEDLLLRALLRYRPGTPWHEIAAPLFARLGPGQWVLEPGSASHGPRLQLLWRDATTRLSFAIPHESREPIEVEWSDSRQAPEDLADWREAVRLREESERQDRLGRQAPLVRLPRKLENLPLGAAREEILAYLPRGQAVTKREWDAGMLTVVNTPPPRDGPVFSVRHLITQFDADGRLWAVRVRYDAVAKPRNAKEADWPKALLEPWRKSAGVVPAAPSPYTAAGIALPPQTPAGVCYRWQDDITEAMYVSDRNGVEITLSQRPKEHSARLPLRYLPLGPGKGAFPALLGMNRSEFEAASPVRPVPAPEGAWAVGVSSGPYDAFLFWFDDRDHICRIAGRFRLADPSRTSPKDLEKALSERWGTELREVGWPCRRDFSPQGVLQSLTWFDDRTRYRLYWADSDDSPPRLWAEWVAR
jgi:hypothetical protein